MFNEGISYENYLDRSDRHQDRMKKAEARTEELLEQEDLQQLNVPMKVLTIAENWCGDCGNGVPVISLLAAQMDNWEYSIVPRDDFEEEVERFYTTAGRKKIPVVVFADEDGEEINRWIERPKNSYETLRKIQEKRLKKEEYIKEYKSNPELNVPGVCDYIFGELKDIAGKSAAMIKILPSKK